MMILKFQKRTMMINYNQSDLNLLNDLHDIVGQDYETGKHDLIEFMFNLLERNQLEELKDIITNHYEQ